jgi:hypothetical protein
MSYTTAQLDAIIATLEAAMGTGAASITFEGRRIDYKSNAEIAGAIAYFQAKRDQGSGTRRPRQIRMYTDKGF